MAQTWFVSTETQAKLFLDAPGLQLVDMIIVPKNYTFGDQQQLLITMAAQHMKEGTSDAIGDLSPILQHNWDLVITDASANNVADA